MPTVVLPGTGIPVSMTDEQYKQWLAQGGGSIAQAKPATPDPALYNPYANAPTLNVRKKPTGTTSSTTGTPVDPCLTLQKATLAGQKGPILDALSKKCQEYREAQAFSAQSPEMSFREGDGGGAQSIQQVGMSTKMKIALIAGGVLLVGGIAWYATR